MRENERLKQQLAAASNPRPPSEGSGNKDISALIEDYPEAGEAISALQGELDSVKRQLAQQDDADRRKTLDDNFAQLTADDAHPDFLEVTASKEFAEWLQAQPRMVTEAALRNAENIVDVAEAKDIMDRYKQHAGQQGQKADPNRPVSSGQSQSARPSSRRERQLAATQGAPAEMRRRPWVPRRIPKRPSTTSPTSETR